MCRSAICGSEEPENQRGVWHNRNALEWRNWQTHGTQNPAAFTGHESSTLSSSTNQIRRSTLPGAITYAGSGALSPLQLSPSPSVPGSGTELDPN